MLVSERIGQGWLDWVGTRDDPRPIVKIGRDPRIDRGLLLQ
jgi:hypothetical protein